jgi:hypothetical protein
MRLLNPAHRDDRRAPWQCVGEHRQQALILHTLIVPLAIIMALTLVVAGVCATR